MTKNIIVTDRNGDIIGYTYPKRARGLVKNGRACFVDDCTIRLSARKASSDNNTLLEDRTMNYIFFNTKQWTTNEAERFFMNDAEGGMTEVLSLGGWNVECATTVSSEMDVVKGGDYHFVFWLNGGENDKNTEVCQLQVCFDHDVEKVNTYKLNRFFIKPLKYFEGWELYDIPFAAEGDKLVLKFVAGFAPMAIKAAKEPEAYEDLPDQKSEAAAGKAQRHNIFFEGGWPNMAANSTSQDTVNANTATAEDSDSAEENGTGRTPLDSVKNIMNTVGEKVTDGIEYLNKKRSEVDREQIEHAVRNNISKVANFISVKLGEVAEKIDDMKANNTDEEGEGASSAEMTVQSETEDTTSEDATTEDIQNDKSEDTEN